MTASTPTHIPWASDFLSLARRYGSRTAVVDALGATTYADLMAHAAGIGQAVLAAGARSCEPVGNPVAPKSSRKYSRITGP